MILRRIRTKDEKSALNVHRQANLLRRYFLPKSVFPPPGIPRTATGNRNVVISSNISANSSPTDSAILQFDGTGIAVWRFKTKFNNPPISTAIALRGTPGSPIEIYAQGQGTSDSVIFVSTDVTDNRNIFVHALGNPN
jgi:hypothetical protein